MTNRRKALVGFLMIAGLSVGGFFTYHLFVSPGVASAELVLEDGKTLDSAKVSGVLSQVGSCKGAFTLMSLSQKQGNLVAQVRGCTGMCCLPKAKKALEGLEGVKSVSLSP